MTAPFAPPPPPVVWYITFACLGMFVVLPFGRRGDWLGYLACAYSFGVALFIAALMFRRLLSATLAWYRDTPLRPENPKIGECYRDHVYSIVWDEEYFCLQSHSNETIQRVFLARLFELIDDDAFFLQGTIAIRTSIRRIEFPGSRSARFKLNELIRALSRDDASFRLEMEKLRKVYRRRGVRSLLLCVLVAGVLMVPILSGYSPDEASLTIALVGIAFGMGWYWIIWKFAYSLASLVASVDRSRRERGRG